MEERIQKEIAYNLAKDYVLGTNIYLGMALKDGQKVCIAVAYRINYCIKKVDQFLALDPSLQFVHISKIKVGETVACEKFKPTNELASYY